ncbi:helix-turn-helix domain-containing protein [Lacinutrix sp. C3R15]|uniref:helix-turn-helix domain-containing protein n=1 Tax=Flavobacteriaceae TaxID=49546 RepID=UPI001C09253C|nr:MULTISPECIES: helix-turn-helix domain-containing protein [Flavobacteriaceae]MBU2938783.1 helix-turn-helix domain-containing protein [Lacinutrix sp. C3R15]MDO6622096.1 helix-turn-helix domain-containing protein [Oceanihabitans sp. 1_MG-2023]
MHKYNWNTKIQIIETFDKSTQMLSNNSMGIYFERNSSNTLVVYFKPLNEVFNAKVFNDNQGVLINFERDLIEEDDIEYALDVFSLFNKYPQFHINNKQQVQRIEQFILFLQEELCNEKASYIMFKSLLKVMLLHLIRYQNDSFLKQDLNQKRVFQFLELMEATFLRETNTSYYASEIGISSKRLNQILKEKLNLTAKQIIQQRQITEAKRSLVKGEITTKELAFQLGFDSLSSFSRFFKKNVGVSPSVFKLQN